MILFLILGGVLGALSVLFVLQNTAVVTVAFFSWHLTGSLALILFATLASGVVATTLVILPALISDEIKFARLKKQNKTLEDELATRKSAQTSLVTPPRSSPSI